ncbi:MAG TPA: sulfatase-like hydrolase/transferase [Sedimentibacter sp.]|nr:sulfatase-like hydrolase/transferase [Sedimentibacter sp.]
MKNKINNIIKLIFFPILILYFETLLKVFIYEKVFNIGYVYMWFFSIPMGLLFYLFSTGFKEKTNKIIFYSIITFLTLYYGTQIVYYSIFYTFTSFYSMFVGAGNALQFTDIVFTALSNNIFELTAIFLPVILLTIFHKKIEFNNISKKNFLRIVLSAGVIQFAIVFLVLSSDRGMLSPSYLYSDTFLVVDSVDKFGLLTTGRLDIKNILKNLAFAAEPKPMEIVESEDVIDKEDNTDTVVNEMEETFVKDVEYNIMNIPFEELIKVEGNESIKSMHEYFNNVQPTKKNEYTGKYKGKNLILITAEGFSPYAVNKDLTPTLYKMQEEGFKFKNFYTPLWGVSTSDGEYVACTGLLPKEGIWSFYKSSNNYMPFAMGNQLKRLGYETKAYHNHYYNYYFRNESHPNLGYTYKGLGNGLDVTETWPESDLEMIDLTVAEYIVTQPFHVYYMTVSGHLQYNFYGNYIAAKNRDMVENLPYSDNVKAYLACNIELDKAMEKLIDELEKKGIAQDTLIAISPDHYPYGLTLTELSELANKEIKTDFDLYKGVFLLWSKGMEAVEVDKYCSSLDIIPTLSNLMGLEYDSRLLMGRDILSDSEPLVLFSDRSWITDKALFNVKTGEVKSLTNENIDKYIEEIEKTVKDKFKYSAMILESDYYKILK